MHYSFFFRSLPCSYGQPPSSFPLSTLRRETFASLVSFASIVKASSFWHDRDLLLVESVPLACRILSDDRRPCMLATSLPMTQRTVACSHTAGPAKS
jgi:hypothetical protein